MSAPEKTLRPKCGNNNVNRVGNFCSTFIEKSVVARHVHIETMLSRAFSPLSALCMNSAKLIEHFFFAQKTDTAYPCLSPSSAPNKPIIWHHSQVYTEKRVMPLGKGTGDHPAQAAPHIRARNAAFTPSTPKKGRSQRSQLVRICTALPPESHAKNTTSSVTLYTVSCEQFCSIIKWALNTAFGRERCSDPVRRSYS